MEKIYSKIEEKKLLHIINRFCDISCERADIIPAENYIQLCSMKLMAGKKFRAHKHIPFLKETHRCQETFMVVKGKLKVIMYDTDDSLLGESILHTGDVVVTLEGGHNYECLEDDTVIYEHKTGPYLGIEKDKVFL